MTVGMQREKSATASAMRMSDVVFSYLMEFFFTQDNLNFLSVFGSFLVTFSVLIIVYFKHRSDSNEKLDLLRMQHARRQQKSLTENDGCDEWPENDDGDSSVHPSKSMQQLNSREDMYAKIQPSADCGVELIAVTSPTTRSSSAGKLSGS